jgi:sulfate adenylyltransferase subunit 1
MDILKFITAGSVDDGKSTLIGRLLYDSKSILVDQLAALEKQSKNKENGQIDLAILTDGLRAEREQGITIDVAYKYFSTPKRKFIIADAPGHIQYTRNMVTGASNADLIIILVDARKGVIEQTKRHSLIASMLGIPQVIVAVNKMDLVNYSEDVYNNIVLDYHKQLSEPLGLKSVTYIPVSALKGDNIVEHSANLSWYKKESLLGLLEKTELNAEFDQNRFRFPVQYIIRPQTDALHDYRGYAGMVSNGIVRKGDLIEVNGAGLKSRVKLIECGGVEVEEAFAPQSIVLHLEDEIDISRGDLISGTVNTPVSTQDLDILLTWMDAKQLEVGNKYLLQHNSRTVRCSIKEIVYKLNINTLDKEHATSGSLNDVVRAIARTAQPIIIDKYAESRSNGAAILIDETSFVTVGACIFQ